MENSGPVVKMEKTSSNTQVLLAPDDTAFMKKIEATHGPENHEIKAKPLLKMINAIVQHSDSAPVDFHESDVEVEPLSNQDLGDFRELLANKINSISVEILGNCSGGQDVQETLLGIFAAVSDFSWDAKGVIVLAAFAVNYGEFWLVAQPHPEDRIAKSLALLQKIPEMQQAEFSSLKSEMINLTKAVLALIKCICDFKDLKSEKKNIKPDAAEILKAEAQIPTAIYWTIKSIVICQSQIKKLTGTGYEFITSTELSTFARKIIQLQGHMESQLHICYQQIEKNRVEQEYQKLVNLFETTLDDNTKILKLLFGSQNDALYRGRTKSSESANLWQKKTLLLYISGLEVYNAEISVLAKMYISYFEQKKESDEDYDIVWLPIVDESSPWDEIKQKAYDAAQDTMPWLSLREPWLVDAAVIKYIKNIWHFKERSIIVTLNSQGKVVNLNAMFMIMIWGSEAVPFSVSREEALFAAETWGLRLLVRGIVTPVDQWIAEGKLVCLYGGDIVWIREFTRIAKSVCEEVQIPIAMVYMGIRDTQDEVKKINDIIFAENISHRVEDLNQMWLFWSRLECIWQLRVQRGKSPETDNIIQEVFMFRLFEGNERGWAIITNFDQTAKAMGDTMLHRLSMFDDWKSQVVKKGFVTALNEQIHQYHPHCNTHVFRATTAGIPKKMSCFECGRMMKTYVGYRCCS